MKSTLQTFLIKNNFKIYVGIILSTSVLLFVFSPSWLTVGSLGIYVLFSGLYFWINKLKLPVLSLILIAGFFVRVKPATLAVCQVSKDLQLVLLALTPSLL